MKIKLYNTLTHKVEVVEPISDSQILMYNCGPTVYSYYHIGNLRNAVFNDTLRRTLTTLGYEVKQVMNITDVGHLTSDADEGDDKLEKGAAAEGKSVWDVAHHYTEAFKKDVTKLNVLPPNGYKGKSDNYARATDFIPQQISIIKALLDRGVAYISPKAIYFDVTKVTDYAALTKQDLSSKEVAARPDVVADPDKKHPQDFAVWFFAKGHFADHSMRWPSPWGEGFPGWHLECSAIIHATLGDPIDIHTGAVDLIGTHHTNERAQTEVAFGNQLANYWVHNEYVLINGEKMSKSLGNVYTLKHIQDKGYSPLALRLLYLMAHYRSQMNFTWDSLEGAQSFLERLYGWADLKFQPAVHIDKSDDEYKTVLEEIKASMADDLNSPQAISHLSGLVAKGESAGIAADSFDSLLKSLDNIFGLSLSDRTDIDNSVKQLLNQRERARKAGDYVQSDKLRDELAQTGIEVSDAALGQIWKRVNIK